MLFNRNPRLSRPQLFRRGSLLRRWTLRRAMIVGLPAVAGLCLIASPLMAANATSRPAAAMRANRANQAKHANDGQVLQQLRTAIQSLDLTEQQKSQVRDILQQAASDIRSIRQNTSTTQPGEKLSAIRQRLQQIRNDLQQVLTPEQMEKLRPQLQEIRQEMQQHRQELAGNLTKRIDAALEKLNLTPDQQQQITALRADLKTKVQAVLDNPDDASAKEALKTAVQTAREQFQQTLTKEQKEQLRDMIQEKISAATQTGMPN